MFDFEKFGTTEQKQAGDINMNKITEPAKVGQPATTSSGFDFKTFGTEQQAPTTQQPEVDEKGFARKAFDAITSSIQGFGESAGQAINVQLYQKQADELSKKYMADGDKMSKLAQVTTDPVKKELYMNLANKAYDDAGKTLTSIVGELKTPQQVLGEAAGVALDIATAGTYGAAAKGAVTGVKMAAKPVVKSLIPTAVSKLTSTGVKEAGKKIGVGAGIGYAYDVSANMQGGESGFEALTPGFGTLLGAGLPALGYAFGATKELAKGKALDTVVSRGMEKGVRPSVAGKNNITQMDAYHAKSADAVKAIVNNKSNLKLFDKYGDEIVGELPDTLNEFADAVKQTKKVVFDEYDALSKAANKEGNVVDLNRVIPELDKAANDTVLNLRDPGTAKYAAEMAERFKKVGSLTTEQAQQFITDMNADLQSFYRNPSYGSASKVQIDALIANNMREGLDQVIETAVGPGYQRLKNIYGALKTIEKDVNHRALVDARKSNAGLVDFTNIFTYGDIAMGLGSGNLPQAAKGLAGKGVQMFYKWRNDPNTIIKEMFQGAEKAIKKENYTKVIPQKIEDNRSFINKMFPQESKKSLSTVVSKTKNAVDDYKYTYYHATPNKDQIIKNGFKGDTYAWPTKQQAEEYAKNQGKGWNVVEVKSKERLLADTPGLTDEMKIDNPEWWQLKKENIKPSNNLKGSVTPKTLLTGGAIVGAGAAAKTLLSEKRTITINNDQSQQTPEVKGVSTEKSNVTIAKTPDEKNKVIATIVAEAIGEGDEGMQASLNTIQNRAKEKGVTMYNVVSSPAAYSAFSESNKIFSKVRDLLRGKPVQFTNQTEKESVEKAVKKVSEMIDNKDLADITNGATHYANPVTMTDKSWWGEGQETKKLGKHVFKKGIKYSIN